MWDADLVSRVRDRKLNEIMIFASMAKIDSGNIDAYIDIIVSLGDDIDACDTLLDTDGETEIVLDTIDAPEYLERLSSGEMSDEEAFNSLKTNPSEVETIPEDLEDYVRNLISEAVESLRKPAEDKSDALEALKEELSIVRNRNESLSKDLDFRLSELATLTEELETVRKERDEALEKADGIRALESEVENLRLRVQEHSAAEDDAMEQVDILRSRVNEQEAQIADLMSELEAARNEAEKATEDVSILEEEVKSAEQVAAEAEAIVASEETEMEPGCVFDEPTETVPTEESPEAAGDLANGEELMESGFQPENEAPIVDQILTDAQLETLRQVRSMKDAKIDEFIDRTLTGEVDETICDNIVTFLKVDIDICDSLLGMDYRDLDSIVAGFRRVLEIVNEAPEPRSQSVYIRSLNDAQKVLEAKYNLIIEQIQQIMLHKYVNLIESE